MNAAIAKRYATAIFELGLETGNLETLVAEIDRLADTYAASRELRSVLVDPLVSADAKRRIVRDVSEQLGLSPVAVNAALLLVDRRRISGLPLVSSQLRAMGDARKGVVHAEVTVAAPLDASFYARLQTQLERLTGRRVVIDRKEDPSLIGGVITRIGDVVYDGSIRARLEGLRSAVLPN